MTSSAESASLPEVHFHVNLPVEDIDKSEAFFNSLGFKSNVLWMDDKTKSFILPPPNEKICLMIHSRNERFKDFMRPGDEVVDAHKAAQVLFSITVESPAHVDVWVDKVKKAGGSLDPYTMEGYGKECGMYMRSWADLDGHMWEVYAMLEGQGVCPGAGEKREDKAATA